MALASGARPARALETTRALHHYVHDRWTSRDGLPQNSILDADQTTDGYLWFGTYEGLVRFDGVRFKVFDRSTHGLMRRNAVLAVRARRDGGLLFGNLASVALVEGDRMEALAGAAADNLMETWAILEDPAGRVLVGTATQGLRVLEAGALRDMAPELLANAGVRALAYDSKGTLWVGTRRGLVALRDGRPFECGACTELPAGSVGVLEPARDGGLWVGGDFGLVHVDVGGTARRVGAVDSPVDAVRDHASGLWLGTPSGLVRMRDGRVERDPLVQGRVVSLFFDREDSLWVGTDNQGLYRLREAPFWLLSEHDGISAGHGIATALIEDSIWVVTATGVFSMKLPEGPARKVASRSEIARLGGAAGHVWAGTRTGRLLVLRAGRFVDAGPSRSTPVYHLEASRAGLWVGWRDGSLQEIVAGGVRRTIQLPGPYAVSGVHEWPDGKLTIASHGGMFDWQEGRLERSEGVPEVLATGLVAEPDGTLWITTDGDGLLRRRGRSVRALTTRDGLFDDVVFRAVDDGLGYFWMTSNKGIARVSRAELHAVADGARPRVAPRVFSEADGLRLAECVGGTSMARSPDGRLWFPTVAGVAVVDPTKLDLKVVPSLVRVEDVRADGARVEPGAVMPAAVQSVEIDYTALSFRVPGRVRYRYQLHGFDATAMEAGNRRTAYYSKLPHGSYRFVVHAVNEDGASKPGGASFDFSVAPRLHERASVRALLGVLAAVALFGAVQLRTRTLRRRQRTLEALVAERTQALAVEKDRAEAASRAKSRFVASVSHELRTPLNAILGFTGLSRRAGSPAQREEYLGLVESSGAHLLGLVNSVLSLTKIEEGHGEAVRAPFALRALLRETVATLRPRAEAKGLRLLEDSEALPEWVMGDGPKLRQILINLLGNAIKFTARGYVALHVTRQGDRTTFAVEDTGPGIPPDQQALLFREFAQMDAGVQSGEGTGLGLAISRRLAQLQGGDLVLASSSVSGTTFSLSLDLPGTAQPEQASTRRAVGLARPVELAPLLVVDDAPANRRLLRDLHAVLGLEVVEAANGPEALELFLARRPPLVWTDALMPGFGGGELVRRIREAERANGWPRTPAVAVTASALGDEREQLLADGCDAVVLKPFEEGEIFGLLESKLGLAIAYEDGAASGQERRPAAPSQAEWAAEMERLVRAFETSDWVALRRSAHDLRGAAALAGRPDLASTLELIERRAHARGPSESILPAIARARAQMGENRGGVA